MRLGIGNMNAKLAKEMEEQAKQLGNAYLPGAQAALGKFGVAGVNSARVVELFKPYAAQILRVDQADAALVSRLKGLTGAAALSKPFVACS